MSEYVINGSLRTFKFVLTGGPCSGKTTAMSELQLYLEQNGFRVFVVPEAATLFFLNGVTFNDLSSKHFQLAFQKAIITSQINLEDTFANLATTVGQKSVLLCDRGTMDGKAYVENELWMTLLKDLGMTETEIQNRYDAVFHLVTAAEGASGHYTLENNPTRTETPERAIEVDHRTRAVWQLHPRHIVIDNASASFRHKMLHLLTSLAEILQIPGPSRSPPVSYCLTQDPDLEKIHTDRITDVEKIFLRNSNEFSLQTLLLKNQSSSDLPHFSLPIVANMSNNSSHGNEDGGEGVKPDNEDDNMNIESTQFISIDSDSPPNANFPINSIKDSHNHSLQDGAESVQILYRFITKMTTASHSADSGHLNGHQLGVMDELKPTQSIADSQAHSDSSSYTLTVVQRSGDGQIMELKQVITNRVYNTLAENFRCKDRCAVSQRRHYFSWHGSSYQLIHQIFPPLTSSSPSSSSTTPPSTSPDGLPSIQKPQTNWILRYYEPERKEGASEKLRIPDFLSVGETRRDDTLSTYFLSQIQK